MKFEKFVESVAENFKKMQNNNDTLVYVKSENKEKLWDLYIKSFKNDSIFLTQKEHDCRNCKHALYNMFVIGIDKNYNKITPFSNYNNLQEPYKSIAKKLDKYLKSLPIYSLFYNDVDIIGTPKNFGEKFINNEKKIFEFHHIHLPIINSKYITEDVNKAQQKSIENYNLVKASLEKITIVALEIVNDLININGLYRGIEFKSLIEQFIQLKKKYENISDNLKSLYLWTILDKYSENVLRIKNISIGTLLIDLSEGIDVEQAVRSFENKVAPTNYKRTSAVVTPKMIENLKKELEKDDLLDSLYRRTMTDKDIDIKDIIWKDAKIKNINEDIFSKVIDEIDTVKNLDRNKLQNISLQKFIDDILPTVKNIEILGNKSRKMILTTSKYQNSKNLFKWNNPASWYYTGDVADSYIAKRVKEMGGEINTDLRFSLHWWDASDYDIHFYDSNMYNLVYYGKKKNEELNAYLDVDMNIDNYGNNFSMDAVENIIFRDRNTLKENKTYIIGVENFTYRNIMNKPGFEIEIKIGNKKYLVKYKNKLNNNQKIKVCKFKRVGNEIKIQFYKNIELISEFNDGKFYPVSLITYSPNCWNNEKCSGNKHIFFFSPKLEWGDEKIRGFFNEQLKEDLYKKHKKALELIGGKIEIIPEKDSLIGFGYSITQKDNIIIKYTTQSNIKKIIKINL